MPCFSHIKEFTFKAAAVATYVTTGCVTSTVVVSASVMFHVGLFAIILYVRSRCSWWSTA